MRIFFPERGEALRKASQNINVMRLMETRAVEVYSKCPKITTIIRHADETDDSEFHCIWTGLVFDWTTRTFCQFCTKRVFTVPRQRVRRYTDPVYGDYFALRVRPQFSITSCVASEYWLFTSSKDPFGFLVPVEEVDLGEYEIVRPTVTTGLQQALSSPSWFV